MPNSPLSQSLFDLAKDPIQKKSDPKYGAILAQQVLDSVRAGQGYFQLRNSRFKENESFATGRQSMKEYLDRLNIDGKQAFVNLDLTPPPFAPKFMEVLIGRSMERNERPTVTAVDKISNKKRKKEKDEAEWRMKMGDWIGEKEQAIDMPLEDRNKYTPVDEEDLTLWGESELFLDEEVKFQKVISDGLQDSNYAVWKRATLWDITVKGMGVAYVYRDANGNKKHKRCIPENVVYTTSDKDDFSDCKLIGEIDKMKIVDAREYYPEVTEKEWFEMFQTANQYSGYLIWNDNFNQSVLRPYDDCVVEIFKFAAITNEKKIWVAGSDRFGKETLDEKDQQPVYPGGKVPDGKEVITKNPQVVYEGCYSVTSKKMLSWSRQKDMIKPHYALHEVFGPFCIVMPNNINMVNMSMAERCKTSIKQLTLQHLKIQQLVAKMRPDGFIVDIAGLHDVNLGLGKSSSPLELQAVYDQTGMLYYSSVDEADNRIQEPIRPTENNNAVSKIQSLIGLYNFYLQRLRDDLGTNEYVEGQGVNPKLGMGVRDGQVAASNRATDFIYRYFIILLEQIAKRFAVMEWYDVMDGKREQEHDMVAADYADFIPDIQISMLPTEEEQGYVIDMAQTALTAGLLSFAEAFKVKRLAAKDVKLAEIYLAKYEKARKAHAIAENQANIQATAQAQQQSNAQTAENAAQLEQLKSSGKIEVTKVALDLDKNKFIQSLILQYAALNIPIPDQYQAMVNQYLQLAVGSQELQGADIGMKMQQVEQQAQQQQQPQQQ